jgi:hypothetical protein
MGSYGRTVRCTTTAARVTFLVLQRPDHVGGLQSFLFGGASALATGWFRGFPLH